MKKMSKRIRQWIVLAMALCLLAVGLAIPASAAQTSLMEQIQTDKLDDMSADALAHAVAWFTTNDPQTLLPVLTNTVEDSAAGQVIAKKYKMESFYLTSFDGTKIYCNRFRTPNGCKKDGRNHVVILAHGFQVNRLVSIEQVPIFADNGYDVITFDQRQSGKSDHTKCTMGYNEAKDMGCIAQWVRKNYGDDTVLGIHGHSMGAATVMQYSSWDPNLAFMIEDCGYPSCQELFYEIQQKYLPNINFDTFWKAAVKYGDVNGVSYDKVRPIDSIKALDPEVPTMYIHGENDTFVMTKFVYELYNARPGQKKEIYTQPGAGHDQSQMFNPIGYRNAITNFLAKYGLQGNLS